jgi:enoyl-CoA hydratase/carnithine racemase
MVEQGLPEGFTLKDGVAFGYRQEGLFEIKFHRPKVRNAMGGAVELQLANCFKQASEDPNCKVVLLHGGKFFTAGNDLK